jgi:hypothetical protein
VVAREDDDPQVRLGKKRCRGIQQGSADPIVVKHIPGHQQQVRVACRGEDRLERGELLRAGPIASVNI